MDTVYLRHISLILADQEAFLRESLYAALAQAVTDCSKSSTRNRVLDVGVGRGELLQLLKSRGFETYGVDLEPGCIESAGPFGDCRLGGIEEIGQVFKGTTFDTVVCSHVLEHLDSPFLALKSLESLEATSYVFAVPNVLRPVRIIRAVLGSRVPDHSEHVYAWGVPEFRSLLGRSGFVVDKWYADRVTINPLRGKAGTSLSKAFRPVEVQALPQLTPMLSSSLIVRCHRAGTNGNHPHLSDD